MLYVAVTVGLYRVGGLGDTAVVYANIVNLVSRIGYCLYFISGLGGRCIGREGVGAEGGMSGEGSGERGRMGTETETGVGKGHRMEMGKGKRIKENKGKKGEGSGQAQNRSFDGGEEKESEKEGPEEEGEEDKGTEMGKGEGKRDERGRGEGKSRSKSRSQSQMGVEGPGSERGLGLGLGLKMDEVLPSLPVLFAILVSGVLTRVSARLMRVEKLIMGAGTGAGAGVVGRGVLMTKACVLHVGVGVLCGVGVIATW